MIAVICVTCHEVALTGKGRVPNESRIEEAEFPSPEFFREGYFEIRSRSTKPCCKATADVAVEALKSVGVTIKEGR